MGQCERSIKRSAKFPMRRRNQAVRHRHPFECPTKHVQTWACPRLPGARYKPLQTLIAVNVRLPERRRHNATAARKGPKQTAGGPKLCAGHRGRTAPGSLPFDPIMQKVIASHLHHTGRNHIRRLDFGPLRLARTACDRHRTQDPDRSCRRLAHNRKQKACAFSQHEQRFGRDMRHLVYAPPPDS